MRERELAIVLSQLTAQGSRQPAPNRPVSASYPVLTAIISSFWFLPLSRVWVSNARPVVLFCNLALLVLRQICSSLFHAGKLPPSSFIPHNFRTPRSLDLISCLRFPTVITPPLCVQPRPLLLLFLSYTHIVFFCPCPLSLCIFSTRPFFLFRLIFPRPLST